jgi:hypothetical protein
MLKDYANEHPKNKKKKQSKTIKVASSNMATARKIAVETAVKDAAETHEIKTGEPMTPKEIQAEIKYWENKIRGRKL